MAYTNPNCNKCGKQIKFIPLKFYDGSIKNIPVELKDEFIITMSNEKNEKGQYIWHSTKRAIPHICSGNKEANEPPSEDKPPF
jgi:hypothetical protein